MLSTASPFAQFFDTDGSPLDQGFVYFGQPGVNPETAPVQVFWDEEGTQPAPQPIRTLNGFLARNGSPAGVFVESDYSVSIRTKRGGLVGYAKTSLAASMQVELEQLTADVLKYTVAVNSVAQLRLLRKTGASRALMSGYYAAGDGGAGVFYFDSADTTTPDNGGSVIVAADGARWKLLSDGTVSVKQFGARGDGTTDDRAAFQAAIDIFGVNGGKVYVPPGVFAIGGAGINLTNKVANFNGMIFEGAGQGVELKKIGAASPILNILGGRCTVRNLTFNGNSLVTSGIYGNKAFDGRTVLIEDCAFIQFAAGGQGIYNYDGDAFLVRNCYFLNAGSWAVKSRNNMMNSSFTANYIQGSGGFLFGMVTQQAEGIRILDNTILASGGTGRGIEIESGLDFTISNNIIDQATTCGVKCRNNSSYVKITNNWFGGAMSEGHVLFADFTNRNSVICNTFEGGTTAQLIANAVTLGNINSLVISGNQHGTIAASAQGILMLKIRRAVISGNILSGPTGADSIFWNGGAIGMIAQNIIWKAINSDGSETAVNNLVG